MNLADELDSLRFDERTLPSPVGSHGLSHPADVLDPDQPSVFRVLKNQEIHPHGEYCTQRLVLAAWAQPETGELR